MFTLCSFLLAILVASVARADTAGRIGVVDGDTLIVGGVTVRLYGIDAPETAQTCRAPDGGETDCGRWVSETVAARFGGRMAHCAAHDIDRFGRLVATCEVAGRDIAAALVADGLAFAFRRYSDAYVASERQARDAGRGLHAFEMIPPAAFRARARRAGADAERMGTCRIKGNLSADGARIYHLPGQRWYGATRIDPTRGERWFCSEAEASAAGWRRARH